MTVLCGVCRVSGVWSAAVPRVVARVSVRKRKHRASRATGPQGAGGLRRGPWPSARDSARFERRRGSLSFNIQVSVHQHHSPFASAVALRLYAYLPLGLFGLHRLHDFFATDPYPRVHSRVGAGPRDHPGEDAHTSNATRPSLSPHKTAHDSR
eukprot:6798266-Prymnesium_polylepis.2